MDQAPPPQALSLATIAVRLADEGVPLRAIARATSVPSDALRTTLAEARSDGRLLELPRDDWPPGFPRDHRALQLARMARADRIGLSLTISRLFELTATESELFAAMLQHDRLSKHNTRWSSNAVDVHICRLRKALSPFNIAIKTLWGHGYQVPPDDRRRAFDLILV
jgi:Transcriptional regulatory protein, C terminal